MGSRIARGKSRDSTTEKPKARKPSWLFGVIQLGRALSSRRVDVRRGLLRILRQHPRILALKSEECVNIIPDNPSAKALKLQPTRRLGANDIIILGIGDQFGIMTMTADAKAVRAASVQGVDFSVYIYTPCPLTGN